MRKQLISFAQVTKSFCKISQRGL